MELEAFKQSWQEMDRKLEQQISLNRDLFQQMKLKESRNRLLPLALYRGIELILFLVFSNLLGGYIFDHLGQPQFYIPAAVILLFALSGIVGAIGQLYYISQVNFAEPVTVIQKKLMAVATHRIGLLKLTLATVPFFLCYGIVGFEWLLGIDMFAYGHPTWWVIQLAFSALLIPVVIWAICKINYQNMHRPWVRHLLENDGGRPVREAMAVLEEIRRFEQEDE